MAWASVAALILPLLAFVSGHLDEDRSLAALASRAGRSRFDLHRMFFASPARPRSSTCCGCGPRGRGAAVRAAAVRRETGGAGIVLLTATPAKNSPLEFYNLIQYIDPTNPRRCGILAQRHFLAAGAVMFSIVHESMVCVMIGLAIGASPWLMAGCARCTDGYHAPEPIASGVVGELRAVGFSERGNFVAVGDSGVIAYKDDFDARVKSVQPVSADLYAVTPDARGGEALVVGARGTMLAALHGEAWSVVDVGTSNDLRAVLQVEQASRSYAIAVGDEVVVVRDPGADVWQTLAPPEGGWGRLRGVYATDERVFVVGLAGVIWSTEDPHGSWARDASGTDEDLLAVGGSSVELFAVGAGGTLVHHEQEGDWRPMTLDLDVDLVDIDYDGVVLAADGRLFRIDDTATDVEPLFAVGSRSHALAYYGSSFMIVGEGGHMSSMLSGTTPQCD